MAQRYLLLCILALSLSRLALAALDVAVIYSSQATLPGNLQLGSWGNATSSIAYTPVAVSGNSYGLPIASQGRYQGTRLDFTPPIDTKYFFGPRDAFLELYFRGLPGGNDQPQIPPAFSTLHFTFFTAGGIGTLAVPVEQLYPSEVADGVWLKYAIPLCKLDLKQPLTGTMSRMVISTDQPAQFLLGRIAFVREAARLQATITTLPGILETGKPIIFSANATGGLSPVTVRWDFDTTAGASIDATGNRVTYSYVNPGTYTVTCTVLDVNGVKDPVTTTKEIKVIRSR